MPLSSSPISLLTISRPLCSLVRGGQTHPHNPRLVVSFSTCPPHTHTHGTQLFRSSSKKHKHCVHVQETSSGACPYATDCTEKGREKERERKRENRESESESERGSKRERENEKQTDRQRERQSESFTKARVRPRSRTRTRSTAHAHRLEDFVILEQLLADREERFAVRSVVLPLSHSKAVSRESQESQVLKFAS